MDLLLMGIKTVPRLERLVTSWVVALKVSICIVPVFDVVEAKSCSWTSYHIQGGPTGIRQLNRGISDAVEGYRLDLKDLVHPGRSQRKSFVVTCVFLCRRRSCLLA